MILREKKNTIDRCCVDYDDDKDYNFYLGIYY